MSLKGQKILMFVADEYEDLELHYPKYRMREEGAQVVIAGEKAETYKGKHGIPCKADITIYNVNVNDFAALIIPGGYAPDKLRTFPKVLEITKQFHQEDKLIATICHAGWILASAEIIKGVKCTSFASIKDDMIHAGAKWVDEAVVIDQNIITSRFPDDLPHFCKAIAEHFKQVKL